MIQSNESTHRGTRSSRLAAAVLFGTLAAAVLGACEGDPLLSPDRAAPDGPSLALNPACAGSGGQTHTDSVTSAIMWTPAGNPHRVNQLIHIEGAGALRLTAGALVCFGSGGGLRADNGGRLRVTGSSLAPVVLTAADLANGWLGVRLAGTPSARSLIDHVRLEHTRTTYALATYDDHEAAIDSAVFRQNEAGLYLWGRGSSLRRSYVDTITSTVSPAVTLGRVTTFQHTAIRGAAGVGLAVLGTDSVSVVGGRIEGSGGVGLRVTTPGSGLLATQPVRVTGGAGYPAEMEPDAFARLYLMLAYQDSLLGNARDTLVITGGTLLTTVYAGPALPWRVTGNITVRGHLLAGPGATLAFDPFVGVTALNGGRVSARGTAAAPIRFTGVNTGDGWYGIQLGGSPSLPSYLTNVWMEHATLAAFAYESHPLVIDSAVFRQNGMAVSLGSNGSRMSRSRVDTTTWSGGAAVWLGGDAILESTLIRGSAATGLSVWTGTAQVLSCDIRGSAGDGIMLWGGAPVHNCNLVDNRVVGIYSANFNADVEDNWWGDAAGPAGPNGDGAGGAVDYTPWRTTPYVLPYVP